MRLANDDPRAIVYHTGWNAAIPDAADVDPASGLCGLSAGIFPGMCICVLIFVLVLYLVGFVY